MSFLLVYPHEREPFYVNITGPDRRQVRVRVAKRQFANGEMVVRAYTKATKDSLAMAGWKQAPPDMLLFPNIPEELEGDPDRIKWMLDMWGTMSDDERAEFLVEVGLGAAKVAPKASDEDEEDTETDKVFDPEHDSWLVDEYSAKQLKHAYKSVTKRQPGATWNKQKIAEQLLARSPHLKDKDVFASLIKDIERDIR